MKRHTLVAAAAAACGLGIAAAAVARWTDAHADPIGRTQTAVLNSDPMQAVCPEDPDVPFLDIVVRTDVVEDARRTTTVTTSGGQLVLATEAEVAPAPPPDDPEVLPFHEAQMKVSLQRFTAGTSFTISTSFYDAVGNLNGTLTTEFTKP